MPARRVALPARALIASVSLVGHVSSGHQATASSRRSVSSSRLFLPLLHLPLRHWNS